MSGNPITREPSVEKRIEASTLVRIDERRISRATAALELSQLLREQLQGFIPRRISQLAVLPNHRTAEAIGIVQSLQGCLSSRAERAATQWMIRIALELDRSSVARFCDYTASRRALATSRRVISRNTGNRIVRRNEIRNEALDAFL